MLIGHFGPGRAPMSSGSLSLDEDKKLHISYSVLKGNILGSLSHTVQLDVVHLRLGSACMGGPPSCSKRAAVT